MGNQAPFGVVFGHDNFPPTEDPANEETKKSELYPENIQDMVNESYTKNKVLPRVEGKDYVTDEEDREQGAESKSTFPNKY